MERLCSQIHFTTGPLDSGGWFKPRHMSQQELVFKFWGGGWLTGMCVCMHMCAFSFPLYLDLGRCRPGLVGTAGWEGVPQVGGR